MSVEALAERVITLEVKDGTAGPGLRLIRDEQGKVIDIKEGKRTDLSGRYLKAVEVIFSDGGTGLR